MDELSEAELRYYNDLFKICSESSDSSGKIPALKATSLFRSANLSNEVINKVGLGELHRNYCGSSVYRLFYLCLNLFSNMY